MESEFAHSLVPWVGYIVAFLMGIVNLLIWNKYGKLDEDVCAVKMGLDALEKKYLEKHADIKDLEIKMGAMENRIIEKIAGIQAHMSAVATALALKDKLTRAGFDNILP